MDKLLQKINQLYVDTLMIYAKNKVITNITIAIPVRGYSFIIINWTLAEIKQMDTKVERQITCNRIHHPRADIKEKIVEEA